MQKCSLLSGNLRQRILQNCFERNGLEDANGFGSGNKTVYVYEKNSKQWYTTLWHKSRDRNGQSYTLTHFVSCRPPYLGMNSNSSCGYTRPFTHGKVRPYPREVCVLCDLYSHSETAHGKSLWIHQKEQKNYPSRFLNQVVGFSSGLSNHKSSSTNQVEENSKSGNRST